MAKNTVPPDQNFNQEMELIDQSQQHQIQAVDGESRDHNTLQSCRQTIAPIYAFDEESGNFRAEVRYGEGEVVRYYFSGDPLIVNVGPKSKKDKFSKFKSCTILAITSQLAGTLLAVSKQGLGDSNAQVQVQALLYTSALANGAGFLSALSGLWLQGLKPSVATALEAVGCGFTVVGFVGMMGIFFL